MKAHTKKSAPAQSVRSINLLLDCADPAPRLDHFHLTRKGAAVLHKILTAAAPGQRSDRVMTVAAPPGSGKSFLALFTGALLQRRADTRKTIEEVLSRASARARFVRPAAEAYLKGRTRILPVYLVGETPFGLHSAILHAIEDAIVTQLDEDSGARALRAVYTGLRQAKILGPRKDGLAYVEARRFFEAFEIILDALDTVGFTGLALFHDEFNRFLARESRSFSAQLDFLQDLAEYTVRKAKPVFLVLLTHKSISQYADQVSPSALRDWLKIEGRFHPLLYQEDSADIYSVLAHRIASSRKTDAHADASAGQAQKLIPALIEEFDGKFKELASRAAPLTPAAFLALPLVSNLLGQNERTAFGFVDEFVPHAKSEISLGALFDYFDTLADRLESTGAIAPWLRARKAIAAAADADSRRILKALALLTVIDSPLLPATPAVISWATDLASRQATRLLEALLDRGLAVRRESTGKYEVHYGSAINVRRAVDELATGVSLAECEDLLQKAFSFRRLQADAFNAHNYSTRHFSKRILLTRLLEEKGLSEADGLFSSGMLHVKEAILSEVQKGACGVVLYLLGESTRSGKIARQLLRDPEIAANAILISSRLDLAGTDALKKYAAVRLLLEDRNFIEKDPRSKEDLELMASDLHEGILAALHTHFSAENGEVAGKLGKSTPALEAMASARLKERYPLTPRINCELINRDSISPNIRNARKKVIRGILDKYGTEMLGFSGHGPEVTIFRCLFTATESYRQSKNGTWQFDFADARDCRGGDNEGLTATMAAVHNFLTQSSGGSTMDGLYQTLESAPYGVCREIIPLLLLAALAEEGYAYSLYEEKRFIPEVNSDVFEKLHSSPARFTIRVLAQDEDKAAFLQAYEDFFKPTDYQVPSENRLVRSLLYVLQWYTRLPESSRNSQQLSRKARAFLEALPRSQSPETLLFETLPQSLESPDVASLRRTLQKLKHEIDAVYPTLLSLIQDNIRRQLTRYLTRDVPSDLVDLVADFLDANADRISVAVHHDLAFRRLIERFRMPYATPELLAESVSSLLIDAHPRYWKDDSLAQMEMNLVTLLARLDEAFALGTAPERVARLVRDFQKLSPEERKQALFELEAFSLESD